MTTSQGKRAARSWRSLALKALTVAGFAAAVWLLSGSAAQADAGNADLLNMAPVTETVTAPLGGLFDTATDLDSVAGLAPVAQTMNTATRPVLDVTSDVLGAGSESGHRLPGATNQVVSALARTTRGVVSAVSGIPAEVGTPLLSPLGSVVSPVTDVVRPLTAKVTEPGVRALPVVDIPSRQVTAVYSESPAPPLAAGAAFAPGGPPAVASGRVSPELASFDRDLVIAAPDVTAPVTPSKPLPAPTHAPGTANTGSTGSLPGSHQDSGASFALAPGSVTHSTPLGGLLPVTSFIGTSRDSAADPMVSPD